EYNDGIYLGNKEKPYLALMGVNNKDIITFEIHFSTKLIGGAALANCNKLTNIGIPSGVISIGDVAFNGCSKLTAIEIPSKVTDIGDYVFSGCDRITSIEMPSSVKRIGIGTFAGCDNLEKVIVDNENKNYRSDGNCLIEKATNTLIWGCKKSIIQDYVTSIGDYAFAGCSSLISIEIPSSVTYIGDSAFSYCTSLTSIEIPSSVTSIGSSAFYDCSSLTIYCEAESQPSGWHRDWNSSDRPVVWGYKKGRVGLNTDSIFY
ncbi:MAG: leucine-rich repeat domain-containing protein, partial [Clostridia bacterium]|nr:leucine-rich repeat domain-containing protein [Clostridia bacterium]